MAYALDYQNLAGSFVEAEFGHTFEYRVRQDKTNYRPDLPHLIYVGDKTNVIMIEGQADEMPEDEFIQALHFAQEAVAKLVAAQEELAKLAVQLSGQSFIVRQHECWPLDLFDDVGHRERLTGSGNTEQHLSAFIVLNALNE